MKFPQLLATLSVCCYTSLVLGAPSDALTQSAIYFLRVDPRGSTIVAVALDSTGKLTSSTSSTSTQGVGLQAQNFTTKQPVTAEPLQSQGSVTVGDNYLFTVNSGSNTTVMFKVDSSNPLHLQIVGQPAPSLGEFPSSVAYSSKYKKVCVLNSGAVNGVTCYNVSPSRGLVPDGKGLRKLGFPSTTPPQLFGPSGSGSDISFSPDSSKVLVSFKGTTTPSTLGHIPVFDVSTGGDVALNFKDNRVPPIGNPYGFVFDGNDSSRFFVANPKTGFAGAVLSLDESTDTVSLVSTVNNTAFHASCWSVWSAATGLFSNIDAISPHMGKISSNGELEGIITYSSSLEGGYDGVVIGSYIYFLSGVNKIGIVDQIGGDLVQAHQYFTASNRPFWTGLAAYPA